MRWCRSNIWEAGTFLSDIGVPDWMIYVLVTEFEG